MKPLFLSVIKRNIGNQVSIKSAFCLTNGIAFGVYRYCRRSKKYLSLQFHNNNQLTFKIYKYSGKSDKGNPFPPINAEQA